LQAQGLLPVEPAGGIFSTDLFTHERGEATIFVPCAGTVRWWRWPCGGCRRLGPVHRSRRCRVPSEGRRLASRSGRIRPSSAGMEVSRGLRCAAKCPPITGMSIVTQSVLSTARYPASCEVAGRIPGKHERVTRDRGG
jgi:hypothetical protein